MSIKKWTRRDFLKFSGTGVIAIGASGILPLKAEASNEISWLMHPVHFKQMGSGELFEKLESEVGIKIKATQMPFPEYREKLSMFLRQGSSDFDIIGISNAWWDASLNEFLAPLNEFINNMPLIDSEDILTMDWFKVGDSIYAVPYRVGPRLFFFRKDIYKKHGLHVPKTLEEYKENARIITKKEDGVFGAFIMGEQSFFSLLDFHCFLFSSGGAYFDSIDLQKANVILNNAKGLNALDLWASFNREKLLPPGVLSATWDTFITGMQQGKIAQGINWSVYLASITDPKKSKVPELVGWAEPPYGKDSGLAHGNAPGTGWGLYIPIASKRKELAWKVIRWITNPENDLYMALHKGGPFRVSTFRNPKYAEVFPAAEVVGNALKHSAPMWKPIGSIKRASEVVDRVVVEINSALAGKKSPDVAIDSAADIVKRIVLA